MADQSGSSAEITIEFSEQQMELIRRLADAAGNSPEEAVAAALNAFIRAQGNQYMT